MTERKKSVDVSAIGIAALALDRKLDAVQVFAYRNKSR